MIPCPHTIEELSAYIDGELRPEEHHSLRCHLAICSSCQRSITTLMTIKEMVTSTAAVYPLPTTLRTVLPVASLPARRVSSSPMALFRKRSLTKH